MTKWNDIPFDENAPGEEKASEFDRQYEENKKAGDEAEEAGKYRPEPGLRTTWTGRKR